MNRKLFILLFFNFLFLNAKAQLLVGTVAGGEISKIFFFDPQRLYKSKPSLGFEVGVMASMRVRKNFLLNVQLLYSQRSRHIVGKSASPPDTSLINPQKQPDPLFDLSSTMHYIELPITYLVEFKRFSGELTGQGGQRKAYNWFIGGGPIISYWLNNQTTLKSSNLKEVFIDHVDYKTVWNRDISTANSVTDANKEFISSPNRFQFGLNITGGLSFEPVGLNKIITSLQLNIAQTFLARSNGNFVGYNHLDDIDVLKAKNHSIRFSVAYLFDTKIDNRKKGKSTIKIPSKRKLR